MSGLERARLEVELVKATPKRLASIRNALIADLGYEPRMSASMAEILRSKHPPAVERAHERMARVLGEAQRAGKRAAAAIFIEETATAGDHASAVALRAELEAAVALLGPAFEEAVGYPDRPRFPPPGSEELV